MRRRDERVGGGEAKLSGGEGTRRRGDSEFTERLGCGSRGERRTEGEEGWWRCDDVFAAGDTAFKTAVDAEIAFGYFSIVSDGKRSVGVGSGDAERVGE